MPEIKQLNCFVVCADVGSFSEAAKILYTTQSNVSKMISALEEDLKVKLFNRNARGITLTEHGKKVYDSASEIMKSMNALTNVSTMAEGEWLRISVNPNAWFAKTFAEFYNTHKDKKYHYHIKTASSDEIMERVAGGRDDLGFLYIFEIEKEAVRYHLSRNNLEFVGLADVEARLYLGGGHSASPSGPMTKAQLGQLRFVQMYQDYYSKRKTWEMTEDADLKLEQIDVAVITNSDYLMEAMLENTDAANVRAADFAGADSDAAAGISISDPSGKAAFGYVKRKDEKLKDDASKFVNYVRQKLSGN